MTRQEKRDLSHVIRGTNQKEGNVSKPEIRVCVPRTYEPDRAAVRGSVGGWIEWWCCYGLEGDT